MTAYAAGYIVSAIASQTADTALEIFASDGSMLVICVAKSSLNFGSMLAGFIITALASATLLA